MALVGQDNFTYFLFSKVSDVIAFQRTCLRLFKRFPRVQHSNNLLAIKLTQEQYLEVLRESGIHTETGDPLTVPGMHGEYIPGKGSLRCSRAENDTKGPEVGK